ncbi:hypothetical protein WME75_32235 [Sorangium sp. So ce1014]|uniref:hypothetical protein n=1 Tax=Sorangium sp. So ce1014 TaxID=3133326 RepID=UPI003F61646A
MSDLLAARVDGVALTEPELVSFLSLRGSRDLLALPMVLLACWWSNNQGRKR